MTKFNRVENLPKDKRPLSVGTSVYVRDEKGELALALVVKVVPPKAQLSEEKKYFSYKVCLVESCKVSKVLYHRRARGTKSRLHCYTIDEFKKAHPTPVPSPSVVVATRRSAFKPKRNHRRARLRYNTKAFDVCPWCPFRGAAMKRTLLEHMCGEKSCVVPLQIRHCTKVVNKNSFANVGDSGHKMLTSLGFADPEHFVDEYMYKHGGKCPHCEYKSIAARKVARHIKQVHKDKLGPRLVTL